MPFRPQRLIKWTVALVTSDPGVLAVQRVFGLGVVVKFELGFPAFFFVAGLTLS